MNKTILITGATSGIGEALAKLACQRGHTVIACGRNADKLADMAEQYGMQTRNFDVTDETACRQVLGDIICDIAVLNAGTCEYVDVRKIEPDMFKRVFDANIFGVVNVMSALLPNMKAGNKLVFVDSLARLLPFTRSQAYGASKAALNYIAKSMQVDLQRSGIEVQTLSPGFVKTPLTDKNDFPMPMLISSDAAAEYMLDGILSSRSSVYFPKRFAWMIRLMNMLPETLQLKICSSMKPKAKRTNKK